MKKLLFVVSLITAMFSCTPDLIRPNAQDKYDNLVGNTLFNYGLVEYKGPDTDNKLILAKDNPGLQTAGIRFKARQVIEQVNGVPQYVNKYTGTIYQGSGMYWPTKAAVIDFPVNYLSGTEFMLGTEQSYNLGKFDGIGESLEIWETYPVPRYYKYSKISD